ncbi:MAG TPA: endopeptidase La [Thermoanaerobaculia bacterium]|nr:endopeptidase La [Thermoanaerobaculia bacterium]
MTGDKHHARDEPAVPDVLPVLPLRDTVLYPFIIVPLSIGGDSCIQAVDQALTENRVILLCTQRDPTVESPGREDLYPVGTAAVIMRMLKLPDGRVRILVQGLRRARIGHLGQQTPFPTARVEVIEECPVPTSLERDALVRSVRDGLERVVHLGRNISSEVMVIATNLDEPGRLADLAASNLELDVTDAQQLLETLDPMQRLRRVSELLEREIQLLTMQQEISAQARGEIDRSQREYFLRQQLKAIQDELGDGNELAEEIAGYRSAAAEKVLSDEAQAELDRQLRRLERSPPDSIEGATIRTYLDWLVGLPWGVTSIDDLDLDHARNVLDEDHYDLDKVKERILEYLAVRKLKADARGPILCFVGPPGVGKTSLGRSIARALGRGFARLSLGGVHDEAEIRGHRRTYVGSLPGRIIQGIHHAGTSNPVFMVDEIDKIGADYRGDPSSALLEVLDPEQNETFRDHYLGVAYDLSKVLFITTANMLEPIQPAFLDRMEVLRISGYTSDQKLEIARRHLIPKQIRESGLSPEHIRFTDGGLRKALRDYTKESGVRGFEREIAALCRKVAVRVARGEAGRVEVSPRVVERLLGPAKHFSEELLDRDRVGVATGLAWTAAGGDILLVEAALLPGKGQLLLTGHLGEVMKESAQAALSYARRYAQERGIDPAVFSRSDLHIHVPAGSIPKDGPSAGVTIATAIVSVLVAKPIDRTLAMTGELTLRGEVMPIGGVREKILAALGAGVKRVALPAGNRRDLREVPPAMLRRLSLHLVETVEEVLELALIEPAAGEVAPRAIAATSAARPDSAG